MYVNLSHAWLKMANFFRTHRRYTEDGMVANLIATYDEDGNGRLSLPEFTEMCRSVRTESGVRNHARLGFT